MPTPKNQKTGLLKSNSLAAAKEFAQDKACTEVVYNKSSSLGAKVEEQRAQSQIGVIPKEGENPSALRKQ
jgi:hypothetical protein